MIKYEWADKCDEAFQKFKRCLTTTPVLTLTIEGNECTIYSNGSKNELGCVLMQDGKVIAYASR